MSGWKRPGLLSPLIAASEFAMAQFDVYRNPNPDSRDWAPFLVDLQHDMLGDLATRIMAPLLPASGATTLKGLSPDVQIDGARYFVSMVEMASVPVSELSSPRGDLRDYRQNLLAAVDLLFTAV